MLRTILALLLMGVAAPALATDFSRQRPFLASDAIVRSLSVEGAITVEGALTARSTFKQSNTIAGNTPGCSSAAGARATDGTLSWEPTCFGTFSSLGQTIFVNPTRGTPVDGSNNSTSTMRTPFLVQAQAKGDVATNQNGAFINLDIVGGPVSASQLDSTNAVGLLISSRQRPSASGERPPTAWGFNTDHHIAPGSGAVQSYGYESDLNNFNQDCYPGSPCLAAWMFINGINAYPSTAFIYAGAGTTTTWSGTITIAGSTVTRASGPAFTRSLTKISIAGSVYRVNFVDGDHMTVTNVTPTQYASPAAYSSANAMTHDGILFAGENQVSDNDIHLSTSAHNAVTIDGKHEVGINLTNEAAPYGVLLRASQKMCLGGIGGCMAYDTTNRMLTYNGGRINLHDTGILDLDSGSARCVLTPGTSTLGIACSSDARLKADIVDASTPDLGAYRVREFTERATGRRQTGVIAQEVRETHPELVHEGEDGMLTVDQPNPWVVVKAVQDLRAENSALRWELRVAEVIGAVAVVALALRRRPRPSV